MDKHTFSLFESGRLAITGEFLDIRDVPWNAHNKFSGVFLKNIVTAEHTRGLFTCHLVRIAPGSRIGMHSHPESMELHEVVAGEGLCLTESGEIPYVPGSMAVLPENSPHEVRAGEGGLCLFAKFIAVR